MECVNSASDKRLQKPHYGKLTLPGWKRYCLSIMEEKLTVKMALSKLIG